MRWSDNSLVLVLVLVLVFHSSQYEALDTPNACPKMVEDDELKAIKFEDDSTMKEHDSVLIQVFPNYP